MAVEALPHDRSGAPAAARDLDTVVDVADLTRLGGPRERVREVGARLPRRLQVRGLHAWRLTVATVRACMRFRVTGLAAEGAFFALLSLPPLVFGLVASLGYLGRWVGRDDVAALREEIAVLTEAVFTSEAIADVILPTFDSVTTGGRADLTLLAFGFSVWSGSRALNVIVDTISIMYGLGGHRGIVATRLLSLSTYLVGLLVSVVVVPLVLIGPQLLSRWLPDQLDWVTAAYWPVLLVVSAAGLTSLYHLATPVRSRWWRDLPGAVLALLGWVGISFVLRFVLSSTVGGSSTSIYGPLAAPIIVLIWFYFLSISVLIGAGLNAAVDQLWPDPHKAEARELARTEAADRRRWTP